MTLGAVVVGTGFGARVHVPALRAAGFEVRALVGRDRERTARRAERLGIEHACTSLADALGQDRVDAVTIAAPPDAHAALAIEACEAGRHVICEKPFALDAVEAEAMVAAADTAGVTALVGHEFRWAPDRATTARAIAGGIIGEPRLATLVQYVPLVADPDARAPEWWFDAARGGGWLGASGSHVVDQVRGWFGELASVSATLPTVAARIGAEDSFVVRATSRSGVNIVMQQTAASWAPGVSSLTMVAGTDGTIEIDGEGVWCSDRSGRRLLEPSADLALPPPPAASDDPRHRYTHLEVGPYTRLCEALRAGIESREPPSPVPVPTFADGLACMRVLDAIRASAAAAGETVAVSP
ncbi:MAG TPA: Gfo/Idh/MocA family oxidoreductase [Acidimicrobiia bacterium]|nr:Gfo/Idh/MocA family oxidoreductase [Acidimicrobiia bacterium]